MNSLIKTGNFQEEQLQCLGLKSSKGITLGQSKTLGSTKFINNFHFAKKIYLHTKGFLGQVTYT
jgi:hypothetical protein